MINYSKKIFETGINVKPFKTADRKGLGTMCVSEMSSAYQL